MAVKHPNPRTPRYKTEKQRRFVEVYSQTGNAAQSAIAAGYSPRSAYQIGSQLVRKTAVEKLITDGVRIGMDTLIDVAMNSKVDIARVNAANSLIERGLGKAKANDADKRTIPNVTLVFNKVDTGSTTVTPNLTHVDMPVIDINTNDDSRLKSEPNNQS